MEIFFDLKFVNFISIYQEIEPSALRSVQQSLTDIDTARYNQGFVRYYSAVIHKAATEADKKDVCKRLVGLYTEFKLNDFKKNFYLVGAHKQFGCNEKYPSDVDAIIKNAFSKNSSTTQEVYFNFFSSKALKLTLQPATLLRISRNLQ